LTSLIDNKGDGIQLRHFKSSQSTSQEVLKISSRRTYKLRARSARSS
jgi:hypothetical protein